MLCPPSTHFADGLKQRKCLVPHLYVPKISQTKPVLLNLTFLPSLMYPDLDVQQWPSFCLSFIIIAKQMQNIVSNRAFSEAADIMGESRQYGDKGNVHMSCMNLLSLWRMTTRSHRAEKVTPAEPCVRCWHGSSSHLSQNPTRSDYINYWWDIKGVPDPDCCSSTLSNANFFVFIKKWLTV